MPTKPYLVGFFNVEGHGSQNVATPLTGDGRADTSALWALIRDKFPGVQIDRVGSAIEHRDDSLREQGMIEYPAGATIQQLFRKDSDSGSSLTAGSCQFGGQECLITLRFHHARNQVGVSLLERTTHTTIRFGGTASGQRLASELPRLIAGIVGEGRDYKWKLVEV